MVIYLIRHAHALAGADDAARPLGRKGRRQVRALADWLRRRRLLNATTIWHSPLRRSRQTAVRLVERLRIRATLVAVSGLLPEDDPATMARRLGARKRSVAVVGHEPHLSALASLLVVGTAAPARFQLRKGAVLALERRDGQWIVRWQVSPEEL